MSRSWRRPQASGRHGAMTEKLADGRYHFGRPAGRRIFDTLAAPAGALLFGGFALAVFSGLIPVGSAGDRILFGMLMGFFALLLAVGTVDGIRRSGERTALIVGPDGIWTPDLGPLLWSDVAQLRLESYVAPHGEGATRMRRLGIVPVPRATVPTSGAATLGRGLASAYYNAVGRVQPGLGLGIDHLAPFGIEAYELDVPLEEVLERVREFRPEVIGSERSGKA
jgi:hypothetical protein